MIDQNQIGKFVNKKLQLDIHPSLVESGSVYYLLNGDVQSQTGDNWFVQNQLSNELCYPFEEDYVLLGKVKLNSSEYLLFFETADSSEIGIFNSQECTYSLYVNDPCLGFNGSYIRGVYKFNNSENDRRVYFIDGDNPNRYVDIDKPFPKRYTGSRCDSCTLSEEDSLDCEQLRINKLFRPPCVSVTQNEQGQLLSGVYQVGIAYSIDNLVLTDYYFSPVIKLFSESANIGLNVEIECVDTPFDQYSIILVTNTRENSLVVYNMGFFSIADSTLTLNSTENATILSTQQAVQKKPIFDHSQHIATNGEILLFGKHQAVEPLKYQPLANEIEVEWIEIKVPKSKAHLYPNLMRDEVIPVGIQWFGKRGNIRGEFHIPGRAPSEDDLLEYTGDNFNTNDIYEKEGCDQVTKKRWQIENTAFITAFLDIECNNCSGEVINKVGSMGYWESQDFTYPNDTDTWGDLACQPIRHHRLPSHNLTHTHEDFFTQEIAPDPEDCYEVSVTDQDGNTIYTYEYCPSGESNIIEDDCVNILALRLTNIQHPLLPDLSNDPDISGYRVLIGDRKGNKSILHKGLIFNTWTDTSLDKNTIYYPNYPFNDLHADVFLSTKEVDDNSDNSQPVTNWLAPRSVQRQHFTYHSPDIHFRETKQEFGTEMKIYGESVGWIEGNFSNVYLHPQTRLGIGSIQSDPYTNHAAQLNSVAHYSKFVPWTTDLFSRFQILSSQYLLPINQLLSNGKKFNNTLRESSYYLETGRIVTDPTTIDVSRILASELGYSGNQALPSFDYFNQIWRTDEGINSLYNLQASSYHVGIKINLPNQYGSLEQINYRPVGCITNVFFDPDEEITPYTSNETFAGDTYITRHSTLRKMPIFTEWLSDVSIDTETNYQEFRNLWYPRFWYDNLTEANDRYNLDGFTDLKSGGDILAYGKFYVFVTGVIHYWCESEFIGDYRERDFTPNGNFYPKADYKDISRADILPLDNKYLYNLTLLNNEIERFRQNLDPTNSDADFTVNYSLKNDLQSQNDKWLQFLPLNYTILPRIYGRFSGMHYTDDYSIFFAFENEILYSQLNYTLNTNEGNSLLLTQGDIFTNRLRKLSNETETGFTGCVDPLSFINTRYGTFFIDRYRKKFLQWNGSLKDVTGDMESWLQHFIENTFPGYESSIISVFDNYTNNVYITGGPLRAKWTLSYKPKLESFISFHTFVPDHYFSDYNTYLTSNSVGIWKHNKEFEYQSYYGVDHAFEVGFIINSNFKNVELQSMDLFAEFIKQEAYGSNVYKIDKFFDKILAYNNQGSTGLMTVLLKDKNNPLNSIVQNSDTNNPLIIEVAQTSDSIYRFNKFESIRTDHNNQPLITLDDTGMTYTVESVDPTINPRLRQDIKGKWLKIHLRSEENTDHKIITQLIIPTTDDIKT